MKTNYLFTFLLCAICLLASCSDDDETIIGPTSILGKWEFVKIEEANKTVLPVTNTVKIRLEFSPYESLTPDLKFQGNNLLNTYNGTASFTGHPTRGSLTTQTITASEVGGETKQMEFDAIYLGLLANATSYSVTGKTLTIQAKGSGKTAGQTYKLIFERME